MPAARSGFTIQLRVAAGFSLILAIMAAAGGNASLALFDSLDLFRDYREATFVAAQVSKAQGEFSDARIASEAFILSLDPGKLDEAEIQARASLVLAASAHDFARRADFKAALRTLQAPIEDYLALVSKLKASGLHAEASIALTGSAEKTVLLLNKVGHMLAERREVLGPEIETTMSSASRTGLVLLLGSFLVGGLASLVVGRSIAAPVRRITRAMKGIARGDLATAVPDTRRRDEIGAMAAALLVFKANAEQVERLRHDSAAKERAIAERRRGEMGELANQFEASVKRSVDGVTAFAERLEASSEAMTGSSADGIARASYVAAQAREAASSVSMVANATEELSASVAEIAQRAGQSTEMARETERRSRQTAAIVRTLSDAASRIGEVVSLIETIASKTNLLALNATIEAARAGEAGKGFAVVAAEVKSLAGQTAQATREITAQVQAVQTATSSAATAMHGVAADIEGLSAIALSISGAVNEQRPAINEISRSSGEVAAMTEAVSENIAAVRAGANDTSQAAHEFRRSASELGQLAAHLEVEVGGFLRHIRSA